MSARIRVAVPTFGWIPIIGLAVDIWLEHEVNGVVRTSARDLIASMKDKLFFERDANAYAGLNRIVPADKVIPLPNGQTFPWVNGCTASLRGS